jgi:hypothetical protein
MANEIIARAASSSLVECKVLCGSFAACEFGIYFAQQSTEEGETDGRRILSKENDAFGFAGECRLARKKLPEKDGKSCGGSCTSFGTLITRLTA